MSEQNQHEGQRQPSLLAPKWEDRTTFTVEEMGEILGFGRCTAYALVKSGEIPAIRIRKSLRIHRAVIERKLATA